jgi:hypothetical protein
MLAAGACGRIDFDPLGTSDAPPSTSDGVTAACWMRLASGPARRAHVATYDPVRDRIVLFGGSDGATTRGETWEWDGSVWNVLAPTQSPAGRTTPAMTFDAATGRTMLVAGFDGNVLRADTWEWNGAVWTMIGSAPARSDHAIAYRFANSRVLMFGGYNSGYLGDTEEWTTTWTQITGVGPAARDNHAMAYDRLRDRVVLFGGSDASGLLGDTWEWDGSAWSLRATTGPPARERHAAVYDSVRQRVVMFGGESATGSLGDTWEWDGVTWMQVASSGPSPRNRHAMAYDALRQQVIIQGGTTDGVDVLDDTWAYTPATCP